MDKQVNECAMIYDNCPLIRTDRVVAICLVIIVYMAFPIWPFWGKEVYFTTIILAFITITNLICYKINVIIRQRYLFSAFSIIAFAFYFVFFRYLQFGEFHGSYLFFIFASIVMYGIKHNTFCKAFEILSKSLAIILVFSLVAYVLNSSILKIPILGVIDLTAIKGSTMYMDNYFFFVKESNVESIVPRFYSIFGEPGELGTLSAMVLYANKFDFKKWYNVIILIGTIPTFSLAYVFLVLIGIVFFYGKDLKKLIGISALGIVFIGIVWFMLINNESFNTLIVNRIANHMYTSDYRSGDVATIEFQNLIHNPKALLIGHGFDPSRGAFSSNSYKNWILENGLLGVLVIALVYWNMIPIKNRKTVLFYILMWISFIQRPGLLGAQMLLFYTICFSNLAESEKG